MQEAINRKGETMKKACLLLVVVLCLVAVAFAAANFSGTWVLDQEKSDPAQMGRGGAGGAGGPGGGAGGPGGPGGGPGGGGGGGTPQEITITMSATEMTISRATAGGASETKYMLDGKENTATTQRGELKYKAVWDGGNLTISGTRTSQRGGESPMKEVYSLSADGKVLTVATTRSGQQGETIRKQVYNKK
jgi:hypothetical protein